MYLKKRYIVVEFGKFFCVLKVNIYLMCIHENKRKWMDFLLYKNSIITKLVLIYVFNVILVKKYLDKKITNINDIIPLITVHCTLTFLLNL